MTKGLSRAFGIFYKGIIKFSGYLLEDVRNLIYRFNGHKEYQRFIILTRSRTGSTFLVKLLNEHNNLEVNNEIYGSKYRASSQRIWNRQFGFKPQTIAASGFKLMYYHDTGKEESVWSMLSREKNIKVIHLQRENMLRSIISREIAMQNSVWHSNDLQSKLQSAVPKTVHKDPNDIIKELELTENSRDKALELLRQNETLEISYEALSTDPETIQKVFTFLNLPNQNLSVNLKKLNPEPLSELITNYEDVKNQLNGTKWEYLLNLP